MPVFTTTTAAVVDVAAASAAAITSALSRVLRRSAVPSGADLQALHHEKVARVARTLQTRTSTKPVRVKKKAVPHQVPKAGDLRKKDDSIDVSDLDQILHIDPVRRLCTAEAGVTFVELVAATLQHGLVPLVVPELKEITVGGAIAGCSLESMSFSVGGFHDTCVEYEVVTAEGEVLTCTPDGENSLVFHMVHGTFGTVGILTRLTFRLVPAKPWVHVVHEKHTTLESYQRAIAAHTDAHDVDFMDGIIHAPDLYVLCVGHFVDSAPYTHSYDWMRIYYQSTKERDEDYLKTADYFFRYDKGVTNVNPSSFLGRLFLGRFVSSSTLLGLADRFNHLLKPDSVPFTLDVFIPFSKLPAFLAWQEQEIGHFPLWCVPYRRVADYHWIDDQFLARVKDDLWVDIAIYGMKPRKGIHQKIEAKLYELGGIKTLISHNHYSEEQFWKIWNKKNYDAVKQRTDPRNIFRDLYTKTCKTAMGIAA